MTSAVFIVSEHGYWGEECVRPLKTLTDADFEITVATPTGHKPSVDERSIDPDQVGEELADEVKVCHRNDERLNDPVPLAQIDPDSFDTAVFPGGHGTLWDVNQDVHARTLLRHMLETNGKHALVVCHAVGILAFTRDSNDEFIVDGRNVTGFPNEWEAEMLDDSDCLPDGRKLPYWVEDEVKIAGGNWDAELDEETSVTVDGSLITARGPASSEAGVQTLLETIKS
jgi:putative intracellular protease/amidase